MKEKSTEQEFIADIRSRFEHSIQDLDRDVTSRLAALRTRALAGRPTSPLSWLQVPVAALLFICLAVVFYNVMVPSTTVQPYSPDDIELMTTLDSLDLYNDAEFYEWLDRQGSPT